jgi:hypothetical protein
LFSSATLNRFMHYCRDMLRSLLFKIANLVFRVMLEFHGFAGTGASSLGVLEYWSVGKSESPNLTCIGPFITPPLHHSSRLPQGGKSVGPAQGALPSRVPWVSILDLNLDKARSAC